MQPCRVDTPIIHLKINSVKNYFHKVSGLVQIQELHILEMQVVTKNVQLMEIQFLLVLMTITKILMFVLNKLLVQIVVMVDNVNGLILFLKIFVNI